MKLRKIGRGCFESKRYLAIPIWIAIGTLIFADATPTSIAPAVTPTHADLDNVSPITTQPAITGHHQSLTLVAHDKSPESDRIRPGPVAFETIFQTEFGHSEAGVTVINDPDTWSIFWQQNCSGLCAVNITSGAILMPPIPQIDFTTHTVIVASPGLEGNPGYQFNINTVIDHAHHITVDATLSTPGLDCLWIQVIVFPEQIVIIPKTSLPPILDMNTVQAPACPV